MAAPQAAMEEQEGEQIRPISRFSTSTSLRMSRAQENSIQVVPMPRWSSIVGCTRFALAVLTLAFTAAATAIWGGYGAFGFALFTSSASLLIFAYYFVALSRQPTLYNRWAILGLEIAGVLFWLVSFIGLAHWTSVYNDYWYGDGDGDGYWRGPYGTWDAASVGRRSLAKRGTNKYSVGLALAGTAAGLAGVEFLLYLVTLIVFGLALHKQQIEGTRTGTGTVAAPATSPAAPETVDEAKPEETTDAIEPAQTEPEHEATVV